MYSTHDCSRIPQRGGRKVWFKMMETSRPFVSIIFIIVLIFIIRGETPGNRRIVPLPEPLGPPQRPGTVSWKEKIVISDLNHPCHMTSPNQSEKA
jgi:hypothetical protein